jgi:hypothetical protein
VAAASFAAASVSQKVIPTTGVARAVDQDAHASEARLPLRQRDEGLARATRPRPGARLADETWRHARTSASSSASLSLGRSTPTAHPSDRSSSRGSHRLYDRPPPLPASPDRPRARPPRPCERRRPPGRRTGRPAGHGRSLRPSGPRRHEAGARDDPRFAHGSPPRPAW